MCLCVSVHGRPWIYGAKMLSNLARALASDVNEPIAVATTSNQQESTANSCDDVT